MSLYHAKGARPCFERKPTIHFMETAAHTNDTNMPSASGPTDMPLRMASPSLYTLKNDAALSVIRPSRKLNFAASAFKTSAALMPFILFAVGYLLPLR